MKKLRKNKRGSEVLPMSTLIEFILLAIVVSLMILVIAKQSSSTRFEKTFLAKDIAMFVDSIYASPNNLVVKYPQKTHDFSFRFEKSKVIVFNKEESFTLEESFPFTEDTKIEFEYKVIPPEQENEGKVEVVGESNIPIIFRKSPTKITPFSGIFVEDTE